MMTAAESDALPAGVVNDSKGRKNEKKKMSNYKLKLQFCERCPEASEICKLHPSIKSVYVPSRPASVRFCVLKCKSAKALEEVRKALHRKHIEPYRGLLKCYDTNSKILSEAPGVNKQTIKGMTQLEKKLAKTILNKQLATTRDVLYNSTARELLVRYGVTSSGQKISKQWHTDQSYSESENES
ncbi:Leucyl/phenylalanyl-tRNA--protein transferase [Frankliniella fusca]|uniref:Leucyl/phenylalanyl-tRNA--protein transferase n=1 Tax=Frankliniella fusca TaxID=407009 RepID=A0AAE1LKF9_9NEOP|nr:Leucyl/phenylalanyl-tRNA--protein transferase [Frankliniella fusca]